MIYLIFWRIFREYFPLFPIPGLVDIQATIASQQGKRIISVFHSRLNLNFLQGLCMVLEPSFFRVLLIPSIKLDNFKLVVQRVFVI